MKNDQPAQGQRGRISNWPGAGVLFSRKSEGQQPHFQGGLNINGVEYRLAAWRKTSRKGVEYISLAIDEGPPRGEKPGRETQALDEAVHGMAQAEGGPPDEEPIPF